MNERYTDFTYVFHSTKEYSEFIQNYIKENDLDNCEVISDNKIKSHVLKKSAFAVAKSGTVSLEISNAKIPSIIIYKMGLVNFLLIKMLVKTKYANILNIAAKEEVIPELLQSNCNSKKIFEYVSYFLNHPKKIESQVKRTQKILDNFKTSESSSFKAATALNKILTK